MKIEYICVCVCAPIQTLFYYKHFFKIFQLLTGLMPTPIIIGKVIDTTCLIWQKSCSTTGACLFYDVVDFRVKLHVIVIGYKILAMMFYSFAFWKVRKMVKWPSSKDKMEYEVDHVVSEKEGNSLINDQNTTKQNVLDFPSAKKVIV